MENKVKTPKNVCFVNVPEIPQEFVVYHVGPKNQRVLTPFNPLERGIFFSLSRDQASYYFRTNKNAQFYYADVRLLNDALYQKDYQSSVICRDLSWDLPEEKMKGYIDEWYTKHTFPFNMNRIGRMKKRMLGYLIVPGPIEVISD